MNGLGIGRGGRGGKGGALREMERGGWYGEWRERKGDGG